MLASKGFEGESKVVWPWPHQLQHKRRAWLTRNACHRLTWPDPPFCAGHYWLEISTCMKVEGSCHVRLYSLQHRIEYYLCLQCKKGRRVYRKSFPANDGFTLQPRKFSSSNVLPYTVLYADVCQLYTIYPLGNQRSLQRAPCAST